ncbi:PAS domain-containing protein [Paenibacillus athensensis]|uniref:histidine kinase n=1 Tax=Paenibacillus athensensis TaxID=1967502 RepID=A0A4Y8QAU7_9BACL|nr:ATP-binding protein [Paenibacillus athensensis]MCD1260104.1 PAS domain-containing protein [Paenibacillus athensensis]
MRFLNKRGATTLFLIVFPLAGAVLMYKEGATPLFLVGMALAWLPAFAVWWAAMRKATASSDQRKQLMTWMVAQTPGGFMCIDEHGCLTFFNESALRILKLTGLDREELQGCNVRQLLKRIGVREEDSALLHALESGKVYTKELLYVQEVPIVFDTAPILHPRTGRIVGATAYFQEITEERAMASQLEELTVKAVQSAERLQMLLDCLPLPVLVVDRNGAMTHCNKEMSAYFPEYTRDELESGPLSGMLGARGLREGELHIMRALQGETSRAEYIRFRERCFLCYAYPLTEGGEIVGAVGMYQDVTEIERLRLELNQLERLRLVGQMAASITHEIRNPMAVMRGFIQLISERSDGTFQPYFQLMLEELDRTNEIINDFLSLAQNRVVDMQQLQLNVLLERLLPIIQADANLRGMQVEMRLTPDLPLLLLCEKEIKQLVLNLARNGLEAMESRGCTLVLATELAGGQVALRVSDDGPGIPEERLGRIFEPFYTSKERGTGLGLAVCLSIMQRHEGRMEADSKIGVGTTFRAVFPVLAQPKDEPEPEPALCSQA